MSIVLLDGKAAATSFAWQKFDELGLNEQLYAEIMMIADELSHQDGASISQVVIEYAWKRGFHDCLAALESGAISHNISTGGSN